ncbi:MAG: ArgE/DapE family deacylase [Terriglobia bacterium]
MSTADIREVIDKQELVTLLGDLVSIRSVNPHYNEGTDEKEIAEYIQAFFQRWKIPCVMQNVLETRPNVIGKLEGTDPDRCLLFEAHTDVVSTKGMTIDPFRPETKNGQLYGRGSCDTKGGLAAMLYAMKSLQTMGSRPPASIQLAATMDEEYLFRGVSHLVRSGVRANGAVVAEPTGLQITIAHKGCLRWRIITRGKAAHSSTVHLGINAISKMAKVIQGIESKLIPGYQEKRHPLVGRPTVNVGVIEGGTQVNTVPDKCEIEIDRRIIPGEITSMVWEEFRALLEELKASDPEFDAVMEEPFLEDFPPATHEGERIVRVARHACLSVLGDAKVGAVPYGSDASKLRSCQEITRTS